MYLNFALSKSNINETDGDTVDLAHTAVTLPLLSGTYAIFIALLK